MWDSITNMATTKPELGLFVAMAIFVLRWLSNERKDSRTQTDTLVRFVDTQNKIASERAEECHDRSEKMMERFIDHSQKSDAQRDEVLRNCNTMLGHCSTVIQSLTGQGKGS